MTDTPQLYKERRNIKGHYATAFDHFVSIRDADGVGQDQIDEAFREVKRLQLLYMTKSRTLRSIWDSERSYKPNHSVIELDLQKCRAITFLDTQCSRRAVLYLGDLGVCTQHYNVIMNGSGDIDLWDITGVGMAGHAVLEPFPQPWLWENARDQRTNDGV